MTLRKLLPCCVTALCAFGVTACGATSEDEDGTEDGTDGTEDGVPAADSLPPCDADDPTTGPGSRLVIRFEIDTFLFDQFGEDEEARGPFWGSIWDADDVSALGPDDGASSIAGIQVDDVDLRDGGPTAYLCASAPVDPPSGFVRMLGFVDIDGNADPDDAGPDKGDPATFPSDNEVEITADAEIPATVVFNLLSPSENPEE